MRANSSKRSANESEQTDDNKRIKVDNEWYEKSTNKMFIGAHVSIAGMEMNVCNDCDLRMTVNVLLRRH